MTPVAVFIIPDDPEIEKRVVFVATQFYKETFLHQFLAVPEIFQAVCGVAEKVIVPAVAVEIQGLAETLPDENGLPGAVLHPDSGRMIDPTGGIAVTVVVEDYPSLFTEAVGVGEDVLVHIVAVPEVVEDEIFGAAKESPPPHEGEYPFLMNFDQMLIRGLVPIGPTVLHAIFLVKTLHLAVTDHGEPRHGDEEHGGADVLPFLAELLHGGPLIRVVHEVNEPFKNFRIELQHVLYGLAIFGILFHFEHVHEGGIVNPVHPQGPDEVSLHEPERLGQKQGIRRFGRDPINHLAPELQRKDAVEIFTGHGVFGP